MYLVASVPLSPGVRSHGWTVWPLILIFGMGVDLDLGWVGIVGQGRRWKVKVKCQNCVLISLLPCFMFKVKGQGQGQRSWVKVKGQGQVQGSGQGQRSWARSWIKVVGQGQISSAQRSILGTQLCWVQQKAKKVIISPRCLSVCRIIARMRLISFQLMIFLVIHELPWKYCMLFF